MVSFDTNVLVYATASISDVNVFRARDLVARAMRACSERSVASDTRGVQQCRDPQSENTGRGYPKDN